MAEPVLRRLTPAEAPRLVPLYRAFFEEDAIEVGEAIIARNLAIMAADDRAAVWWAEAPDGTPVALASASLTFGVEFGWASEFEDLYVVPGWRGRGLARRLMDLALTWARNHGATEALLVITPEAEAAQGLSRLYERMGFRRSARLLMTLDLRAGARPVIRR